MAGTIFGSLANAHRRWPLYEIDRATGRCERVIEPTISLKHVEGIVIVRVNDVEIVAFNEEESAMTTAKNIAKATQYTGEIKIYGEHF